MAARAYLKDIDGGLVDGARDGASRVDDIAHHTHDDGGCPRIETCHPCCSGEEVGQGVHPTASA